MHWPVRGGILLNQCAHCPRAKKRSGVKLFANNEIPDSAAHGFTISGSICPREVLVVRRADDVSACVNPCPHTGVNLDWAPAPEPPDRGPNPPTG